VRSLRGVFLALVVVVGICAGAAGYDYYRFDAHHRSTTLQEQELQELQDSQRLLDMAEKLVLTCEQLRRGCDRTKCADACAGRLCYIIVISLQRGG
jgi:hypothetical protein